ncbi:DUF695 domain-containing protein [Polaromonas sp. YR568]|uniref:DUF695 domain-containing protein n=1 Tax=Polaromonas sp. YR568 TaxID=1855301 RepID=UPI00398BE116
MSGDQAELSPAELAERIDSFWFRFREGETELIRKPVREQVEEINEVLDACLDGLALEMSANDGDDPIDMIATAHGAKERFPLLMDFVKRAPPLAHYRLSAFRTRTDEPDFPMRMGNFELATSDILIGHFADEGQVGIEVMFDRELPSDMQDHARNMAFIMLDHVLGEYDFAIKVGAVDFVGGFSGEVVHSTPLHQFGTVLDSFWTGDLGHTGLFPSGEDNWTTLTIAFEGDGEGNHAIVSVNDGANAVAARPDLGHAVELRLPAHDHATLDAARDLQDQIATRLEVQHAGILSHTILRNGERMANYYVGDLPAALELIQGSVRNAFLAEVGLNSEFDPSWARYFEFAG